MFHQLNDFDALFWALSTDTFSWIVGSSVVSLLLAVHLPTVCAKKNKAKPIGSKVIPATNTLQRSATPGKSKSVAIDPKLAPTQSTGTTAAPSEPPKAATPNSKHGEKPVEEKPASKGKSKEEPEPKKDEKKEEVKKDEPEKKEASKKDKPKDELKKDEAKKEASKKDKGKIADGGNDVYRQSKKEGAVPGVIIEKTEVKPKKPKIGPNENNDQKTNKEAESPPVIDEEKVKKLGNLDVEIKEKRNKFVADLDNMPSQHEFDKKQPQQAPPNAHVVVNEQKCQLYETNNEETFSNRDQADNDVI